MVHVGQPVGWCISDRETTEVIEMFFECLKNRSPNTSITSLMTDDGKLINAHILNFNFYFTK